MLINCVSALASLYFQPTNLILHVFLLMYFVSPGITRGAVLRPVTNTLDFIQYGRLQQTFVSIQ